MRSTPGRPYPLIIPLSKRPRKRLVGRRVVFPQVFHAFTRQVTFYHAPRGKSLMLPSQFSGGWLAPKIHTKTTFKNRYLFGGPVGDEGDPNESIVANLAPTMTPKWSPTWSQKLYKKGACSNHEKVNLHNYLLHLSHVDRHPKGSFFDDCW